MKKPFKMPYYAMMSNNTEMPLIYAITLSFRVAEINGFESHMNKSIIVNFKTVSVFDEHHLKLACLDNFEKYEEIIEWFKFNLSIKAIEKDLSSFEKSMKNLFIRYTEDKNATARHTDYGLIASIPKVYKEAKEREYYDEIMDDVRNSSRYVGTVKARDNFKVKLISKRHVRDRGFWVINALYDEKHLITYFDSKNDIENINVGNFFKIRATVKRHEFSNFNRCKETQLTRVAYQ